jgi:hypothetical protein
MSSTPSHRPVQNADLIQRALRVLEAGETAMQRYVRVEHAAMHGAARVGMDAARHLVPIDLEHLSVEAQRAIDGARIRFEEAYSILDRVARTFHGDLVHRALLGEDILLELQDAERKVGITPAEDLSKTEPVAAEPVDAAPAPAQEAVPPAMEALPAEQSAPVAPDAQPVAEGAPPT